MARKYGMTNGILILSHKIRQLLYLRLLQFATFVDSSQSTIAPQHTHHLLTCAQSDASIGDLEGFPAG